MGAARVLSKVVNLASKSHCSNPCSSRYNVFYDLKKKFQIVEDLNTVIGICEGTLRWLRILSLNMVAQIFLV